MIIKNEKGKKRLVLVRFGKECFDPSAREREIIIWMEMMVRDGFS